MQRPVNRRMLRARVRLRRRIIGLLQREDRNECVPATGYPEPTRPSKSLLSLLEASEDSGFISVSSKVLYEPYILIPCTIRIKNYNVITLHWVPIRAAVNRVRGGYLCRKLESFKSGHHIEVTVTGPKR